MRALTLVTSGFIAHIVFGIVNSILVIRALGESGIGIFVLIRPTLAFFTTLTSLGNHKIRPAMTVAILLLLLAHPISHYVLHEPGTYLPLLFIAPLIIATSLSQKFEAYLIYLDNTTPAAMTSILHQAVKITASLYFIYRFEPLGAAWVIAGLMLAYLFAELFSLLCTAVTYVAEKKREALSLALHYLKRPEKPLKNREAPIQVIAAATEFLEPIIVMQLFFGLGLPSDISRSLYGSLSGFTMPILMMPLFLSHALSKIAKSSIRRSSPATINGRLKEFMKIVFLVSGLYTLIILLYPTEIMNLYFQTSTGSQYLRLLAPFMLLYFFQQIFLAFLSALDESRQAVFPILISSFVRIALMLVLVPHLRFNIFGLIYATSAYLLISTLWIFLKLIRLIRFQINPFMIINPLLVFSITWLFGAFSKNHWLPFRFESFNMLFQISLLGILYCGLCKLTRLWPS